jgi:hypothetical protein
MHGVAGLLSHSISVECAAFIFKSEGVLEE